MLVVFHVARTIFGSHHHVTSAYKAGLVWTFACLGTSPVGLISGSSVKDESDERPFRLGARCGRFGSEYVVVEYHDEVQEDHRWFDRAHAKLLLDVCDQLYLVHVRKHKMDASMEGPLGSSG